MHSGCTEVGRYGCLAHQRAISDITAKQRKASALLSRLVSPAELPPNLLDLKRAAVPQSLFLQHRHPRLLFQYRKLSTTIHQQQLALFLFRITSI